MKSALRILFFSALLFSFSLYIPQAFAVETQAISAYPTHPNDTDPRSKSWFIYSIPAGDKKDDSVTVVNNGKDPMTVKVYAVDSTKTAQGGFALANGDVSRHDVGAWVKISTSELTLQPKEKKEIPFTIFIPSNTPQGDHAGGIIIQQTTLKKVTSKNGMGINVISRIGVRIYETVPGLDQLRMEVRDLHYTVTNNTLGFTFTVENKGTVFTSPTGMLEVKDMFGRVIENISLNSLLGTMVPGKPVSLSVPTHVLSPALGWNTALVALYYSPTKAAVAHILFMPNPWPVFVIIFVVLLAIVILLSKKYLVTMAGKGKNKKKVLAPHIKLIVGLILLGTVALSCLLSMLLSKMFGGQ